ncbi:ATP-binding SpoIIE family protein phosphatase [Marinagarivorans cellulosilyticus]|uniref:Two-component system, HptB-dependent secretion and biofilm response regulator n=1 Tax=Marinagarivorans cellulosilyticus TaxID=2721545 RepID=A0AAN2BL03_9GAMM|nr:fused response regulator/phosphatase [Marinagarivorans cellulosilyticus]BCD98505.1 two-component system, HptB-dependent secretion and biofilm response regulator [Marinagarivorans cellulosilyticus]
MKILIVDDHAYNRELLVFILEDEGHECVEAENGQIACELFAGDEDIQLILMDVNMPIMDGIEATKAIKTIASNRFVTIIFVTALDNADVLVQCLDAGGDDFVPKPINESILISKLKAHARSQDMYNSLKSVNEELEYHKRLMDREHRIVEHIFSNDVGVIDTVCDNVTGYTSPASLFNGDLLISAPSPAGGVYLLVGDFTGHGLSAAVGSLPVSSIFYDCVARQESVSNIARIMNRRLLRLLPQGMFFCAALLYLEPQGRQVQFWMGGMNDIVCRQPGVQELLKLQSLHMPLGVMEEDEFDERIELVELPENTALYIFTDGINEAKNLQGEEFGLDGIDAIVIGGGDVVDELVASVREFTNGCEQADDVTVVELLCSPVIHRCAATKKITDVGADYRNAKSFPWQLKMHLSADDLRSSDIVLQVGKFLGTIQGVELHQDKIFTIISELYSNALEHGVLGLSSALKETPDGFDEYYRLRGQRLEAIESEYINIEMQYIRGSSESAEPNRLKIVIADSGDGFDVTARKARQDNDDVSYGRGLSLLETFCESLDYSDCGSTVTAVYTFS